MRREKPEPEKRLWLQLRAARFDGREIPPAKGVGRYIADFAAP
jgi:very-short-patch-repair endonuclease